MCAARNRAACCIVLRLRLRTIGIATQWWCICVLPAHHCLWPSQCCPSPAPPGRFLRERGELSKCRQEGEKAEGGEYEVCVVQQVRSLS